MPLSLWQRTGFEFDRQEFDEMKKGNRAPQSKDKKEYGKGRATADMQRPVCGICIDLCD
jgi:hypothetical protein